MIWWWIVAIIVAVVLSSELMKQNGPKPATIDDFNVPTADEGRPIPVVFGTVDITGSNVIWYGDLSTGRLKKSSLFGSTTVGTKYYLAFHAMLCYGPLDAFLRVEWDEKEAWEGVLEESGPVYVDKRNLFGGDDGEGGVWGEFDVCFGELSQTPNAFLVSKIGPVPAFNGLAGVVWKTGNGSGPVGPFGAPTSVRTGYVGNTKYVKPVAFRVRRVLNGWQNGVWYEEKALIDSQHMNAAHIMYEAMTNTQWGMGIPIGNMDDVVFKEAADTFYDEGMGLSLMWNQASSIEDFLQIILNHCAANLVLNNQTGKYQLIPFRGNYDIEDLEEFTPDDIKEMSSFKRQGWGETVNEITLSYTDPASGDLTSITQQDLGNIQAQGKRIAKTVELKGVRSLVLAKSCLARELIGVSTPLATGKLTINQRGTGIRFGGLFRLTWPERQVSGMPVRVNSVRNNSIDNNYIDVEWTEDIFALGLYDNLSAVTQGTIPPAPEPLVPSPDRGSNVIATLNAPPLLSQLHDGDRFLVGNNPTDLFVGHAGEVAEWDAESGQFIFTPVPDGTILFDSEQHTYTTVVAGIVGPPSFIGDDIDARHVSFDDTVASLGADNVQAAIEALLSLNAASAITVRAFADGLFRAQTSNLAAYDSPDGEAYTARETVGDTSFVQFTYSPILGKFLALRNNEIGVTNGGDPYDTWTWINVEGGPWVGLRAFPNGKHVAWSETSIVMSIDGEAWAVPGASTSYADQVVADNPSAWFQMGDNISYTRDTGPNGYKVRFFPGVGELGTSFQQDKPGLVGEGKSVKCNGLTYVEIRSPEDNVVNIFQDTQQFTAEFWIKKNGTAPSGTIVLFSINRLLPADSYAPVVYFTYDTSSQKLKYEDGEIVLVGPTLTFVASRDEQQVTATADLFDGAAHQVAFSRGASGVIKLYIDGEKVHESATGAMTDLGSGVDLAAAGTILGNVFDKNSPYFSSFVDEWSTYDTALAEARITAHYAAGADGIQAGFIPIEIYYDEPNTQYLVFGQVPDDSFGPTEYRPKVYNSFDLIDFELKSELSDDPLTDNWPIQQVASRLTINQIPEEMRYLLKRPNEATNSIDYLLDGRGYVWIDTNTAPDTKLYLAHYEGVSSLSNLQRYDLEEYHSGSQLGGIGVDNGTFWRIQEAFYFDGPRKLFTHTGSSGLQRFDTSTTVPTLDGNYAGAYLLMRVIFDYANSEMWAVTRDNLGNFYLVQIDYLATVPFADVPSTEHALSVPSGSFDDASGISYGADNNYIYIQHLSSDGWWKLTKADGTAVHISIGDTNNFVDSGILHKGYIYLYQHYFDSRAGQNDIRRFNASNGTEDVAFKFFVRNFITTHVRNGIWRISDDSNWLVWDRSIAIDATDPEDVHVYRNSVIAVMMRNLNSSGNVSKFAYSEDGGDTWNYPSISFPTGTPSYGADSLIYDGQKFLATGKGWSGVATDAVNDWEFSDGTSGLPATSRFVPYSNDAGRVVAAVRGDYGLRGSLFTDDGLHWFQGPEIKVKASEVSYDDTVTAYGAGDVQGVLEAAKILIDAAGSPPASNVSFDPTGTDFVATDVQALGEEIDALIAAPGGIAELDGDARIPISEATLAAPIADSTTARTITSADYLKVVRFSNASAIVLTVPDNATLAAPVGMVCGYYQGSTGAFTITPAGGVTVNVPAGKTLVSDGEGSFIVLHKVAANEWDAHGALV